MSQEYENLLLTVLPNEVRFDKRVASNYVVRNESTKHFIMKDRKLGT